MNIEQHARIKRLLAGLKTLKPHELRMTGYSNRWKSAPADSHDCGTVACVAGWGPRFLPEVKWINDSPWLLSFREHKGSVWRIMQTALGFSEDQAKYLFDTVDMGGNKRDDSPNPLADAIVRLQWVHDHPDELYPPGAGAPEYVPGNEPKWRTKYE